MFTPLSNQSRSRYGDRTPVADSGIPAFLMMLLFLIPISISGCASAVISKSFREMVEPGVSFEALLSRPDAYQGRKVILGGYVLEVTNAQGRSTITVLQVPLDRFLEPESREESRGRFIVETGRFIDPEVYTKGRRVTVGGTVSGSRRQKMGETEYTYPVIEAQELYLWPGQWPSGYYSPFYYYDPWYDPWYNDFYSPFYPGWSSWPRPYPWRHGR